MWGKLGYPRRALRLHGAAPAIVDRHGGVVPAELDELLALPGVGAYTARAVASFAYGRRHPVVDTNVRRVVARAVLGQGDAGTAVDRAGPGRGGGAAAGRPGAGGPLRGRLDGAGRAGLHGPHAAVRGLPGGRPCAWRAAGSPPYEGPAKRPQRFAGTDRQVRGLLLDVLRAAEGPVPAAALDAVWSLDASAGQGPGRAGRRRPGRPAAGRDVCAPGARAAGAGAIGAGAAGPGLTGAGATGAGLTGPGLTGAAPGLDRSGLDRSGRCRSRA